MQIIFKRAGLRITKATFEGPAFRDRLSTFQWTYGGTVRGVELWVFGRRLLAFFS